MSSKNYLPSLDGVRAICIVLVIGSHASRSIGYPASWTEPARYLFDGHLGVLAFFVLSGFLITWLLIREESTTGRISLGAFYMRRVIRILPVYVAYLIVVALLDYGTALEISACRYFTALTYTKNIACAGWIDGHLWSLSVEEQFYLFWPITLILARDRRVWVGLALIIAAPVFRLLFATYFEYKTLRQSFPTNMDALMVGAMIGWALASWPHQLRKVLLWRSTAMRCVSVGAVYLVWLFEEQALLEAVMVPLGKTIQAIGIGYLIASYAVVHSGAGYLLLNTRVLRHVGLLSYSLYIWQQPFFDDSVAQWLDTVPMFMTFPSNLLAVFVVAWCSYYLLEMPLLRLRAKYRRLEELGTAGGRMRPPGLPAGPRRAQHRATRRIGGPKVQRRSPG